MDSKKVQAERLMGLQRDMNAKRGPFDKDDLLILLNTISYWATEKGLDVELSVKSGAVEYSVRPAQPVYCDSCYAKSEEPGFEPCEDCKAKGVKYFS